MTRLDAFLISFRFLIGSGVDNRVGHNLAPNAGGALIEPLVRTVSVQRAILDGLFFCYLGLARLPLYPSIIVMGVGIDQSAIVVAGNL